MIGLVCQEGRADLVFVVDSSGSIREGNPVDNSYDNWQLMLDFMSDLVARIPIGPNNFQIGVVV